MTKGTPLVNVRLDAERREHLDKLAHRLGLTRSDVLREALDRLVAQLELTAA
jgi:predicted DNA-binding protein